ncbi:hypothetical protein DdX_08930 [Ditylenchus destructor]|uniref:Uncharacterized protein n=1 Tax=Ditylenchus destructor TaxID=166010 RepID=A0AAD4R6F5_9BILA|nr:hypothetical protein DdX_08930 [Ditylenchus destructor]
MQRAKSEGEEAMSSRQSLSSKNVVIRTQTAKKELISAIRDFTRAQLLFLQAKRSNAGLNTDSSAKFKELSQAVMDRYKTEKNAIEQEFRTVSITQDLLSKYVVKTVKLQQKTERLQKLTKVLAEKRRSQSNLSLKSVQSTKNDIGKASISYDGRMCYVQQRRRTIEKGQSVFIDLTRSFTDKSFSVSQNVTIEKSVDHSSDGTEQLIEKLSHIRVGEKASLPIDYNAASEEDVYNANEIAKEKIAKPIDFQDITASGLLEYNIAKTVHISESTKHRTEKMSHIPVDESRRLIAYGFYKSEFTWLGIEKHDAFVIEKIIGVV